MRQFRIVHSESSIGWGGQEWRVFLELEWMRKRGHRVWLFAPEKSEIYRRGVKAGISTINYSFDRSKWPSELMRMIYFFKQHQIQILNTHSSRDAWLGGLAAKIAQLPLIIRSRHIEVDYENAFLSRIAFEGLPHHVLTTSSRIKSRLMNEIGVSEEKITCLPTGIDLEKFTPRSSSILHQELHLPEKTKIIGMIAVLRSWKGHGDFLKAAKLLLQKRGDLHFIIAGGGPGHDYVMKLVQKLDLTSKVTLLGYREDIPEILASLDINILPSTAHEGIPQIILQAQAMNCPVIGTRIGGIPDIIINNETGLLVPVHNPEAIASAVLQLLNHPDEAKKMVEKASLIAREKHSLMAMGEKLEEIYSRFFPEE